MFVSTHHAALGSAPALASRAFLLAFGAPSVGIRVRNWGLHPFLGRAPFKAPSPPSACSRLRPDGWQAWSSPQPGSQDLNGLPAAELHRVPFPDSVLLLTLGCLS